MVLKLYNSDVVGNRANCLYPHEIEISNATELASAVAKDHVAAKYKDSYRSVDNFVSSTVLPMDIDNTHYDNPDDWITDEKLSHMMPTVQYALVPSRNHMKEKDGKAARPKYHAFFSIDECADSDVYADMKVQLQQIYPFFDENALDAARFMFASNVSADDIIWHDGFETIEEAEGLSRNVKKKNAPKPAGQTSYEKVIPMGQRNNTLSRFAGIILKKYGNTDRTKQIFVQRAADCEQPLSEHELTNIWMSAVGFYNDTILQDPSYVAPDEYNQDFGNFSMKPSDYSDIGQAELFSNMYKDSVKYTDSTDYIRFRESGCWVESRMAGISAVVEFLNLQLMDAEETLKICTENLIATGVSEGAVKVGGKTLLKEVSTDDQLKALDMYDKAIKYFAFVMKHRDYKYIQSAANTAKHMLEISINDLDADGYLLNTPGMTFDLRKDIAECHEPDPRDLITKQTLCCPGDEGEDLWLDAIDTFFCKDKELIEYVQRIVGMAAIGEVRIENEDSLQNIKGLSVVATTSTEDWYFHITPAQAGGHFNIVNLMDSIIIPALSKYSIAVNVRLDIQNRALIVSVGRTGTGVVIIESDLPNIIKKSLTIKSVSADVNKLILYDASSDYEEKRVYYLHASDLGYDTHDRDRITPVNCEMRALEHDENSSFESAAMSEAHNRFANLSYSNLIELTMLNGDTLVRPDELPFGQVVKILSDKVAYTSILTGKERGKNTKLIFGTVRLDLTKILRKE